MIHLDPVTLFLLVVAAALVLCHGGGALARRCGQPAVVGELAAGVLVAAVVARALPGLVDHLGAAVGAVHALGQLGLVAFAVLLAAELPSGRAGIPRRTVGVLLVGTVLPAAVLGAAVATLGHRTLLTPGGGVEGVVFLATAAAVTALPVLARMIEDLGLRGTGIAAVAVATAAACDALLWCVLAVTLGLHSGPASAVARLGLLGALVFVVERVGRPAVRRVRAGSEAGAVGLVLGTAVATAALTASLGLSAPLGGFVVGLALRGETAVGRALVLRARSFTTGVLLPVVFVDTGISLATLRVPGALAGTALAGVVVALVGVKWAGTRLAARAAGLTRPSAAVTAALLSGRGVTELVVAAIGLKAGLVSPAGAAVLVGAAVLSTAVTSVLARSALRGLGPVPTVAVLRDPIEESYAA